VPADVLAVIARHEVSDTLLVPTMIQMLVDSPALADHDVSSLCRVMYGASPMPEALLARACASFPSAEFTHAYGMTETSPVITLLLPSDQGDPRLRGSAGRPAPHSEVRIVDTDDHELSSGVVGEIVTRGDHLMLGYWQRDRETRTALRGGWMHTGDAGYMDDRGYVFIVDRIKDIILSGGENVYSAEVENVLAKHRAVRTSAVIGLPDDFLGERVHAVVVTLPERSVSDEELRQFCRSHIGGYKVPRSVEFVDTLPLSGAGKVLKRTLREQRLPRTTPDPVEEAVVA